MHTLAHTSLTLAGGVIEERYAERIARCIWQRDCADADEAAQRYMAMRAAILATFINGFSYDGAFQREEHIERLESELDYLEGLIDDWDETTGMTKGWEKLKELSFAQSFVDLQDATPEEQYERLCAIAEQQRGILEALEEEKVPFLIRARAAAAGAHLHRHQCTLDHRLERYLRQYYQLQDRRREHEAKQRKRAARSAPRHRS